MRTIARDWLFVCVLRIKSRVDNYVKMFGRDCFRAQAVMMRARFDQYRDIKDMKQAKLLLKTGEEELAKSLHYQPLKKCNAFRVTNMKTASAS